MAAKVESQDPRLKAHQDSVLATAALLYYKEGLTQGEIATRLGVSRPTVISYLRSAREQNIVDIRINGAAFTASHLSKDLKEKFGLQDAYVASFSPDPKHSSYRIDVNRQVAQVGAMALHDILQPGEVVGAAWGETMQFLSEEVPYRIIKDLTICQLNGSMPSPLVSAAESVAIRISARLGAHCVTLHAPAVLSTPELAAALREEPAIKSQLEKLQTMDRAIFSVGNCDSDTPMVQMALTSKEEIDDYRARGAVGVLCGHFIDRDGQLVKGPSAARMIGVSLDQIKATKAGVLVAGGRSKLNAIRACLAGGYVAHLVTDELVARMLLGATRGNL